MSPGFCYSVVFFLSSATIYEFADTVLPAEYTWVNELSTAELVINFTRNHVFAVASEFVSLWNKSDTEVIPIMGSNQTISRYPLVQCLELLENQRRNHVIQLVFPDWKTFQVTKLYLIPFDHDWIWIHYDVSHQGQNDTQSNVNATSVEKAVRSIPSHNRISLAWTTAIDFVAKENTDNFMDKLWKINRFLHNSKHLLRRQIVLTLPVEHIMAIPGVSRILPSFNAVVKIFVFKVDDPKNVTNIDVDLLRKIIESVGTTISYLNAPLSLKKRLRLTAVDPPKPR